MGIAPGFQANSSPSDLEVLSLMVFSIQTIDGIFLMKKLLHSVLEPLLAQHTRTQLLVVSSEFTTLLIMEIGSSFMIKLTSHNFTMSLKLARDTEEMEERIYQQNTCDQSLLIRFNR